MSVLLLKDRENGKAWWGEPSRSAENARIRHTACQSQQCWTRQPPPGLPSSVPRGKRESWAHFLTCDSQTSALPPSGQERREVKVNSLCSEGSVCLTLCRGHVFLPTVCQAQGLYLCSLSYRKWRLNGFSHSLALRSWVIHLRELKINQLIGVTQG